MNTSVHDCLRFSFSLVCSGWRTVGLSGCRCLLVFLRDHPVFHRPLGLQYSWHPCDAVHVGVSCLLISIRTPSLLPGTLTCRACCSAFDAAVLLLIEAFMPTLYWLTPIFMLFTAQTPAVVSTTGVVVLSHHLHVFCMVWCTTLALSRFSCLTIEALIFLATVFLSSAVRVSSTFAIEKLFVRDLSKLDVEHVADLTGINY